MVFEGLGVGIGRSLGSMVWVIWHDVIWVYITTYTATYIHRYPLKGGRWMDVWRQEG